jgi:diguanylate cyclase (GGDEF)-like protein/PAS domain S-box-containing protein
MKPDMNVEVAQKAILPPQQATARVIGWMLAATGTMGVLSVGLPHPSGADDAALILTGVPVALTGLLCRAFDRRIPLAVSHLLLAAAAVVSGLYTHEAGIAAGVYSSIFVWTTIVAAYFFTGRVAIAHLVWNLAVFAATLAVVPSGAGFSPLTRWLFTAFSLALIMVFVNTIVARRAQADRRARSFFDLSQDMLCTLDSEGRIVEVNQAWEEHLGYTPEDLIGTFLIDITHPDDRKRALLEAVRVFEGEPSKRLENKVWAKDGTIHWLQSSAALAEEQGMLYARATDITELKRVEGEREALLAKVENLASHDALTGLPNRRMLDEVMPREMARARRKGADLWIAMIDIDFFKRFNDAHGHLAGDELLRSCAAAWDSALRGEDLLARYGGEEFMVMLPAASREEAEGVVERLRAATPAAVTCSAGLALWDGLEGLDELLSRADAALYEAKAQGRDRLAHAS